MQTRNRGCCCTFCKCAELQLPRDLLRLLQAVLWRQHKLLLHTLDSWREHALVKQQHGLITRMVTNKRHHKLLQAAWTAWQVRNVNRHICTTLN